MSDGAHLGVTAERALETILGGKPEPDGSEHRSPDDMRRMLAEKDDDIDGYDLHAQVLAKYLLRLFEARPELLKITSGDLSDVAKRFYDDEQHPFRLALSEATGFSWGWAVNAARYAMHADPVPNPAIMTIDV